MQIQKLELMKGAQGLPPAAPPRPDPRGPPDLVVGPQPGTPEYSHWSLWPMATGAQGRPVSPCLSFPFKGTLVFQVEQP